MDLYMRMGDELRSLFKDLFVQAHSKAVEKKIEKVLETAAQIGGSLHEEAAQLHADVIKFLKSPKDEKLIALMKKHALKLEQGTREI